MNSLLEIISGIALILVNSENLKNIIFWLTKNELLEDPSDIIANYFIHLIQNNSINGALFAAYYLLPHGIVKIFIVIFLWKRKLWAYPIAIGILALLVCFQLFKFFQNYSLIILFLTIFDLLVIYLSVKEFQKIKHQYSASKEIV